MLKYKFNLTLLLSAIIVQVLKAVSLVAAVIGKIASRFRVAEGLNTRGDQSRVSGGSPQQSLSLDEMLAARGELGAPPDETKDLSKDTDLDEVDLSLFAPPTVATNQSFQFQVFLHLPNQQEWVDSIARQIDDAAQAEIADGQQQFYNPQQFHDALILMSGAAVRVWRRIMRGECLLCPKRRLCFRDAHSIVQQKKQCNAA
jgi:hypothetical protein